jgi:hypothetical protein
MAEVTAIPVGAAGILARAAFGRPWTVVSLWLRPPLQQARTGT